ncbi:ATP-dependent RNA helicase HrpA [Stieleria sp. JC731]|uniref:ATP-dependent RNA helicase HrpA n=1 Tax=Pirellulaceae TaxID=2691357 RepID=UPI001E2A6D96|nr:ATP-dependent RNA helicase HrpA [Stieleria sp. JC731]MCC9600350.1 ATP-dependent RNA helicase HrpA [Stieleria sp. JC731]
MSFKPSSPPLKPNDSSGSQKSPANPSKESKAAKSSDRLPSQTQSEDSDSGDRQSDPGSTNLDPATISIENAMHIDRFRLARQKKRLDKAVFQQRLSDSVARRQRREAYQPKLDYPAELPISQYREEIVETIRSRQVIVVSGETGSGKSTQLPKFCLEAGLGRQAMIGHTQPRRLAARSIATRLGEELECRLGDQVGYQVRFGDQTGPDTMIKLMTDGILLAETGNDRFLDQYDAIIIDEAHERSLNIDFLLAYLRRLQSKRPDLKIIITSATIDAERFAEHFADEQGPAPILNVEGRGYPVELRYLPWEDATGDENRGYDLPTHVIAAIKNLSRSGNGDTLVFLPTERDIRLVSHRVAGHYKRMGLEGRVEVLPLYARLPQKDQQRIFHPTGGKQRLIFATNVAESSLTVPGIRYVIDSGTARISRYSPRSKLQRLPIEPVSRASADQRAGRCGRVGPGICVRLYSAEDYESRDEFTTPEIKRTNLASVVLKSKTLGLGSLEALPLLEVPRDESIREGIQTLIELNAIDDRHELTEIGKALGQMPVDPRIGRIILAADEFGVLGEVLPIAAALEIADPRVRPPEKQQAADEAHRQFQDTESDFLSLLRLWRFYEQARADYSRSKLTRELTKRFLSPTRMREWSDTYRQLREIATTKHSAAKKINSVRYSENEDRTLDKDVYANVHQALLSGFLSGVAMAGEKNVYIGPRNLKLYLWPGSGVFESKPKWIVAAELVETAKQYARTVARISPNWIESVGSHLLKSSYSDPHWSDKASGAFCYQRQSLFGLPIVVKRRVPLPPIDPSTAQELLISHGLVQNKLVTNARFVRQNRELRNAFEELAAKTRRRDLVVDEYVVTRFYQERLPDEVIDRGRLEKFAKNHPVPDWGNHPFDAAKLSNWLANPPQVDTEIASCYMQPGDLIEIEVDQISDEQFPNQLNVGGSELPLRYRYEPGAQDDGVSLKVHRAALSQISDDRLGWLVPGLLHQKIIAMIKSLPKRIRRNLVPAADVAKQICDELMPLYGEVPFMQAACDAMGRHAEMRISADDFQQEKLEDHLSFLVQVVDDDGETIVQGRGIDPLRDKLAIDFPEANAKADSSQTVGEQELSSGQAMKSFDLDHLDKQVIRERGGVKVAQFPALVDQGDHVIVELFPDQGSADAALQQGLTRLYAITEKKELRRQVRWLPELDQVKIQLSGLRIGNEIESLLMDLIARIAFVEKQPLVRSQEEFERRRVDRGERIAVAVQEMAKWLTSLAGAYLTLRGEVEDFPSKQFPAAHQDVRSQIDWLLYPQFLSVTPWQWLQHYPRYLSAISYRIDKLRSGAGKRDAEATETVDKLWTHWTQSLPEHLATSQQQASTEFRWMIEELRVSLYAQPLGTSVKVSPTRCEKLLSTK